MMNEEKIPAKLVKNEENARARTVKYVVNHVLMKPL